MTLSALVIACPIFRGLWPEDVVPEIEKAVERDFGRQSRRPDQNTKPIITRSAEWFCADGTVECLATGQHPQGFGAVCISYQYSLA